MWGPGGQKQVDHWDGGDDGDPEDHKEEIVITILKHSRKKVITILKHPRTDMEAVEM